MEVPLARRKIDRRDRIVAAALLVVRWIVQLNHALHNKLKQLNIYSIGGGDQNAFSTTFFFFFPLPFFSPPIFFPFGSLVHASEIIYRRTSGTNSLYLDRLGSGSRGFFFFFFFFFPSIYITYYVGTSFERVFRRIDASVSHFKFSRLRSFAFVF